MGNHEVPCIVCGENTMTGFNYGCDRRHSASAIRAAIDQTGRHCHSDCPKQPKPCRYHDEQIAHLEALLSDDPPPVSPLPTSEMTPEPACWNCGGLKSAHIVEQRSWGKDFRCVAGRDSWFYSPPIRTTPAASPPSLDAPAEINMEQRFALKESIVRLRRSLGEGEDGSDAFWPSDVEAVLEEIDRLMIVNGQIAKLWADAEDRATTRQMNAEDLGPDSYGITATGCEP